MKRILILLPLSLFACGPSVTTLVAQHRWNESVCAVSDEHEAELAIPAIVDASKARLVVHEIKREDALPVDDATLGDFLSRYAVYAVDTRIDAASGTSATIQGSIEGAKQVVTASDFAVFTGEKIPDGHMEKQSVLTSAAPSKAFFAFLTVGLSLLVDDRPMTQTVDVMVPPSPSEIEASAPRASKLAAAFGFVHAGAPHFVVARSDSASVRVDVDVKNDDSCTARASYEERLDTVKLETWTNLRDLKWVSLHTTGDHVVDVDR